MMEGEGKAWEIEPKLLPLKSSPSYVTSPFPHAQLITNVIFITNGLYLSLWSDQRIPDGTMICLACPSGIRGEEFWAYEKVWKQK